MHARQGDQPTFVVLLPADLDPSDYTSAILAIEGVPLGSTTLDGEEASASASSPLEDIGLLPVHLTLSHENGTAQTYELEPLVIEPLDPTGWHTLDSARRMWADAPESDELLWTLLDAAREQCIAYLDGRWTDANGVLARVTPAWRQAQLLQSRATWQAGRANRDGGLGPDEFSLPLFPLNRDIRHLLVPKTRKPVIR